MYAFLLINDTPQLFLMFLYVRTATYRKYTVTNYDYTLCIVETLTVISPLQNKETKMLYSM